MTSKFVTVSAGLGCLFGLGALALPALAAPVLPPISDNVLTLQNDPDAEQQLSALMAPIQPLVGSGAGSTTSIDQTGLSNFAKSGVVGSGDVSMISQTGNNGKAVQAVVGDDSALLLNDTGDNNDVAQVAKGDNDFQYVGVGGHNNQVAYLQVGNALAGALNVGNSTNTTVLAIQTPGSSHYLMPIGISGLSNSTVVIVPGRMYVIPKK